MSGTFRSPFYGRTAGKYRVVSSRGHFMAGQQTTRRPALSAWWMTAVAFLFSAVLLPAPQFLTGFEAAESECPLEEDGDSGGKEEAITCLAVRRRVVRVRWTSVPWAAHHSDCRGIVDGPFRRAAVIGHVLIGPVCAPLLI